MIALRFQWDRLTLSIAPFRSGPKPLKCAPVHSLWSLRERLKQIDAAEVGHLETKDDPDAISSWVFFHCDENGDVMICDAFQTLISHELQPEERDGDIEKQMRGNPVKAFRESMGKEECDKLKAEMTQVTKSGKRLDGRPLDAKALQDFTLFMYAMIDACTNPTENTVRRIIEISTDRKTRTCKVSTGVPRETACRCMSLCEGIKQKTCVQHTLPVPSAPCRTDDRQTCDRVGTALQQKRWL